MKKRKISITECADTITESLKKGVFLTTKAGDKVNSMVIGWGHIGRIWERPVFITYVRDCRYTYEMLEKKSGIYGQCSDQQTGQERLHDMRYEER